MSAREIVVAIPLALSAVVALLSAIGVWRVRADLPRIHLAAPPAVFSIPVAGLVICFEDPWTPAMTKSLALCVVSIILSPLVGHALGRASHHRVARTEADDRKRRSSTQRPQHAERPSP